MDHFRYKDGVYHAEDVPVDVLAKKVGTPFYCYSTATLERHYKVFASNFSDIGARICYAVKANGNLAILKTLAKLGAGADVVSEGEIRLALAAGMKASSMVFSGVAKTAAEMAFALDQDIFQFNVESKPELELLNEVAASKHKKARVAVRVNPDVDPKTHAKISTGNKETKFGVSMSQAMEVYSFAKKLSAIEIQGVSVHIGSQLTVLEPFAQAFARVAAFVQELRAAGFTIRTLDLGGGLGIPYGQDQPPMIEDYAAIVKRETKGLDCQLMFEPGRVLVGNAGILVTKVIYIKESDTRKFVIVDAGMNDLIRPALYEAFHDIVHINVSGDGATELVDVVGPVCETGDIFAAQRLLKLPKPGDLIAFRSAGAYGASMSSTYNARPLVPEVMVNGNQYAVVRARESYDQLIGRDTLPEWL